jgi:hypothetical protein
LADVRMKAATVLQIVASMVDPSACAAACKHVLPS